MTIARSVCMIVSRASGAGLYGVGSIALSGEKGNACYSCLSTLPEGVPDVLKCIKL